MAITIYDAAGNDIFGQSFTFGADMSTSGEVPSFTAITVAGYPEENTAPPATIEVSAVSSFGESSEPITLTVSTEIPSAAEGEYCDGRSGIAACAEGIYCVESACTNEENLISECPEENAATELTLGATVQGDNSDSEVTGGGSCGGGGPADFYSFTAATAGDYTFTMTATADNVDPLIIVRDYCRYNAPDFELACNDDIDTEAQNYNSSVVATLSEGQTVYIVADSYDGSAGGTYELTVTAN